jgi:hypothetical protein
VQAFLQTMLLPLPLLLMPSLLLLQHSTPHQRQSPGGLFRSMGMVHHVGIHCGAAIFT